MVADAYNHRLVAVQDAVQQQRELISPPTLSSPSSLAAKRAAIERAVAARRLEADATGSISVITCPTPGWKYPHDVAVAACGDVFVSDFDGNAIWQHTWEGLSAGRGQEWRAVAGLQLNHPCGLSCGSSSGRASGHRLAIADCYNNRVGVCSPSPMQSAAAEIAWSSCPLSHPTGVCWSRDSSSLAVADFDSGRVVWLDAATLQVQAEAAVGREFACRSRLYDVECVGGEAGREVWVATDCVSSRVHIVQRDVRVTGGVAAAAAAEMIMA
jgi:sugar lactone lactonase YvrE